MPPEELNRVGSWLYERFRPEALHEPQGWGAKRVLGLVRIDGELRSTCRAGSKWSCHGLSRKAPEGATAHIGGKRFTSAYGLSAA
jgi:hypothetical protein